MLFGRSFKLLTVAGGRAQFLAAAALSRYLRSAQFDAAFEDVIVNTGNDLPETFLRELEIGPLRCNLQTGAATGLLTIAEILERLAPVLDEERPEAVLVYGATYSTLAAAIAAAHRNLPLVHIEAGERIYRREGAPEEINRVLIDHAASLCLCSTRESVRHLLREGFSPDRVRFVGDPIYDIFLRDQRHAGRGSLNDRFDLAPGSFVLASVDGVGTVSDAAELRALLQALDRSPVPVLAPLDTYAQEVAHSGGWRPSGSLQIRGPVGHLDLLSLLATCRGTVTDSGDVGRLSYYAGKPLLVPSPNLALAELVEAGWAVEVDHRTDRLLHALESLAPPATSADGLFGNGRAAENIVAGIAELLHRRATPWHRLGTAAEIPGPQPTSLTLENYRRMLRELLAAGYTFRAFPEADEALATGKPFTLLRHDVDIDLEPALRLAEVEAELGVRATYFFMLRTENYNVFSAAGSEKIRRILSLNHHIGLHFDCAAYPENASNSGLARYCSSEAAVLEQWFELPVEIVSYHRPGSLVLSGCPSMSAPRLHTYQELFTKRIHYVSDSQGRWRFGAPTASAAFRELRPLHILVHPIWWNHEAISPFEALEQSLDRKRELMQLELAKNCTVFRVGTYKNVK